MSYVLHNLFCKQKHVYSARNESKRINSALLEHD